MASSGRYSARRALSIATALGILATGGCSTIGPRSISQGRTPYNDVIQDTSQQQTLLNLVRVHNGETPLFMDVTEVDAASLVQGTVSGGAGGIGALPNRNTTQGTIAGTVGTVMGGAEYQETPTVRYQPLLGSALVSQVSTPINADSLASLYESGWSLGAILDFTTVRLTPAYDDYFAAVDTLIELDRYGALIIAADHQKKDPDSTGAVATRLNVTVTQAPSPSKDDDNLLIYFQPKDLRYRFRTCDVQSKVDRSAADAVALEHQTDVLARRLWARFMFILGQKGDVAVLTVKPTPVGSGQDRRGLGHLPDAPEMSKPPLLQTRSALGVMKAAAEGDNIILFAEESRIDDIVAQNYPADSNSCLPYFYNMATGGSNTAFSRLDDVEQPTRAAIENERVFGGSRRLILIQMNKERPTDAFTSVQHNGEWYSIRQTDFISKHNLALVAQINTIQAVSPQSGPLTPTISVGAR